MKMGKIEFDLHTHFGAGSTGLQSMMLLTCMANIGVKDIPDAYFAISTTCPARNTLRKPKSLTS
jgi:hypothetical protein